MNAEGHRAKVTAKGHGKGVPNRIRKAPSANKKVAAFARGARCGERGTEAATVTSEELGDAVGEDVDSSAEE